jgi:hypothetical protein
MTVTAAPHPFTKRAADGLAHTDDLVILDYGMEHVYDGEQRTDKIDYEWRHLLEWEDGQQYDQVQVAILRVLKYLPQEARQDPAFLDKMRTVLTGLYNQKRAKFDVVQLLAGIWQPRQIGIVQIYGVTARGETRDVALRHARRGAAALQGTLANFAQAVLEPLTTDQAAWLEDAYRKMGHVSVNIGHPDTRLNDKGLGREGPAEPGVTGQQLEMFLRAMARGQHQFVAPLIASPVAARDLAYMLTGQAGEASVVASLQRGTDAVTAGIALPLTLSANLSRSVASAFGRMRSESSGRSLSISDGRPHGRRGSQPLP